MSDEVIKPPNNTLAPTLDYAGNLMYVIFRGSCLKQDKITFNHRKIVNIYIVYDIQSNLNNFDPALENCLFGAIKITKDSNIYKYKYSGYSVGFDSRGTFSYTGGSFAQNAIIFGVGMNSPVHANNRTKNILILGKEFTLGLEDTTLYTERKYPSNFSAAKKRFCIIMGLTVIYLLMA